MGLLHQGTHAADDYNQRKRWHAFELRYTTNPMTTVWALSCIYLFVCLFIHLCVPCPCRRWLSFCLRAPVKDVASIHLFIYLFICLFTYLFMCDLLCKMSQRFVFIMCCMPWQYEVYHAIGRLLHTMAYSMVDCLRRNNRHLN